MDPQAWRISEEGSRNPPPAGRHQRRSRHGIGMSWWGKHHRWGFPEGSILADTGYSADRTPPCGKRRIGNGIWRDTVGGFYRCASDTERRAKGAFCIACERLNRTSALESARYLSRTYDFSLSTAGRLCDIISRADSDIAYALLRWGRKKTRRSRLRGEP